MSKRQAQEEPWRPYRGPYCSPGSGQVYILPVASQYRLGGITSDEITTKLDGQGVLSVPKATNYVFGLVKPDGTTIYLDAQGVLKANTVGYTLTAAAIAALSPYVFTVASNLLSLNLDTVATNALQATASGLATKLAGTNTSTNGDYGVVSALALSPFDFGIQCNSSGRIFTNNKPAQRQTANGGVPSNTQALGLVYLQPGSNLSITYDGGLDIDYTRLVNPGLGLAQTPIIGIIGNPLGSLWPKLSQVLTTNANGNAIATTPVQTTFSGTVYQTGETYDIKDATTTQRGVVRVDGTTITASAGVISATQQTPYTLPQASISTLGGVKVDGTTITSTAGVISIAQQKEYVGFAFSASTNTQAYANCNVAQNGIKTSNFTFGTGVINGFTVGTVYKINATQFNYLTGSTSDGMRIIDANGTLLTCETTTLPTYYANPRTLPLFGFFTPTTTSINIQSSNNYNYGNGENYGWGTIESV